MADCFIIMPISTPEVYVERYGGDVDHFRHVLEHLFVPAIRAADLSPIPPVTEGPEVIDARIIEDLERAELVLCDMSSLNASVFFRFGIRVAMDKSVCIVRDNATKDIPFDESAIHGHTYTTDLSPWHLQQQRSLLTEHIKKMPFASRGEWFTFAIFWPLGRRAANGC